MGEIGFFDRKIFPSWIQNLSSSCSTHISPQNFFMLTGQLVGVVPSGDSRTPTGCPRVSPTLSQGHGGHGSHKGEVLDHSSGNKRGSKGSKSEPLGGLGGSIRGLEGLGKVNWGPVRALRSQQGDCCQCRRRFQRRQEESQGGVRGTQKRIEDPKGRLWDAEDGSWNPKGGVYPTRAGSETQSRGRSLTGLPDWG